jgi:protein gp37
LRFSSAVDAVALNSAIEWTTHTFNPWWGCSKVSPGCDNCYAERDSQRFAPGLWGVTASRRLFQSQHFDEVLRWDRAALKAGVRHRVFCASMADVFDNHPLVANARDQLWSLIEATPNLDWLLLTKRIGNVRTMYRPGWLKSPPANVWLGISVINQVEADRDIPKLLEAPASVRFLSCEPLLGEIDLLPFKKGQCPSCAGDGDVLDQDAIGEMPADTPLCDRSMMMPCEDCRGTGEWPDNPGLDWVICGGESGANARFMDYDWAFRIASACQEMGIAFFMKQGSANNWPRFKQFESFPQILQIREYPKPKGV